VNSNRTVDLKSKYQDKDRKKIAEQINILKESRTKLNKVLMMRHLQTPEKLYFPFFDYYYELTRDFSTPNIKTIFFNNLKSDLKAVCIFRGNLKFGENAKVESHAYNNDIGLYGNLRMMSKDAKGWFFFGLAKDEH
jgi:single-stranded DNA-specific DHH superfamily exonuclease